MRTGQLDTRPLCPQCKNTIDGWADPTSNREPKPGDISVCKYCLSVLEYTPFMLLTALSDQTIIDMDFVELQRAQHCAKESRENDKLKNPLTKSIRTILNNG